MHLLFSILPQWFETRSPSLLAKLSYPDTFYAPCHCRVRLKVITGSGFKKKEYLGQCLVMLGLQANKKQGRRSRQKWIILRRWMHCCKSQQRMPVATSREVWMPNWNQAQIFWIDQWVTNWAKLQVKVIGYMTTIRGSKKVAVIWLA